MKKMKKYFKTFIKCMNHKIQHLEKMDYILIGILVFVYGILSFYRLGNLHSPNTFYQEKKNHEIIFEFDQDTTIQKMRYYTGVSAPKFQLYFSNDNVTYEKLSNILNKGVFTWNDIYLSIRCKYLKIVPMEDISLGEVAFLDEYANKIPYQSNGYYLSDEEEMVPKQISYMNSAYFDEVYFARTAYEYVHGLPLYEWTHPPLGKLIQAIPIYLTGNFSPFWYRFMGNLAGILLLVVMYLFGALLFQKRGYALLSALFMGLDTFHFAQTRMGTVDSFLVLFLLLSCYFMIQSFQSRENLFLFLSGLFFAFGISVKWTCFFAGFGLAILYFVHFLHKKKDILQSIVKGALCFVLLPISFYCLIFFCFPNNYYQTNTFSNIVREQKVMFSYHSKLNADHFYSSSWYSWPVSYKPVLYHEKKIGTQKRETISGVGNLILWIGGIFAFFYLCFLVIRKKNTHAFYLVVMILSLWLPYSLIHRVMFLYHYFPVLPFLFLALVFLLKDCSAKYHHRLIIPIFLILATLNFILYYPVVSGMPVSPVYSNALELFDSWHF